MNLKKTAILPIALANFLSLAKPPTNDSLKNFSNQKLQQEYNFFSKNVLVAFEEFKKIRKDHNLVNNFILDSTFCAVAQKFAQQLADSNFTSIHNPPFNPFSSRALSLAKFDCNLGEAIAISYNTPLNQNSIEYLINSFLKSNSHKEILLKRNVKYVGIGIATSLVPNQEISKTVIVLIIGFTL